MESLSVREARENFSELLDAVERGEKIAIKRRGKEIAHVVPPVRKLKKPLPLPDLTEFHKRMKMKGSAIDLLLQMRREDSL